MSSFVNVSTPLPYGRTHRFAAPPAFPSITHVKNDRAQRGLMLRLKCLTEPSGEVESEAEKLSSSSSASCSNSASTSISTYTWCAGLGGIGFLETSYLTYLKLTNSDVFCPIGGGTCGDVLNSDYASVYGVPLPLIGMFAYGLVTVLGIQLAGKNLPFKMDETNIRLILLGCTTSMAAASAYFLYILSTKFAGASCSYCLMSALLSFSLFFTTIKDFRLQETQKVVGLQLCLGVLMVAILSTSYNTIQSVPIRLPGPVWFWNPAQGKISLNYSDEEKRTCLDMRDIYLCLDMRHIYLLAANKSALRSGEIELEPFTTEITTESSPLTLALAKHLHSIGAKMYGAFWCSHCQEQKQMFGREAAKWLDYVECFPDGYRKGVKIAKECADARIEGFPTWVINGEVLSGEQGLSELVSASGFKPDNAELPQ